MSESHETEYKTTGERKIGDLVLVRYGRGTKLHHGKVVDMVKRGKSKFAPLTPYVKILCHHSIRNFKQSAIGIVYTRHDEDLDVTCETCLKKLQGDF